MARARASQCLYKERGRRCRRNGTGEPCLCAAHRIVLEDAAARAPAAGGISAAIHELMNKGRLSAQTFERAANELFAGLFGGGPMPTFRPPAGMNLPPNWMPRTAPVQPPPDPKELERARARRAARQVLGFTPQEPLTEEQIKGRRRELALKVHPDKGGDPRDMARVNDACDVLLAAV